jgi:hypothetical protein
LEMENIEEIETLYITIENGLPLEAKLELIALDEAGEVIDTLMVNQHILAGLTNTEGKVTESRLSTLEIDNTDLNNIKSIKATASFSSQPQQEYISIYSNYTMEITLSAKVSKTIGN